MVTLALRKQAFVLLVQNACCGLAGWVIDWMRDSSLQWSSPVLQDQPCQAALYPFAGESDSLNWKAMRQVHLFISVFSVQGQFHVRVSRKGQRGGNEWVEGSGRTLLLMQSTHFYYDIYSVFLRFAKRVFSSWIWEFFFFALVLNSFSRFLSKLKKILFIRLGSNISWNIK